MVTRASTIHDTTIPQIQALSPEAAAVDIIEGLQFGKLSSREAAVRLGVSEVKAREYTKQLKANITDKARERLVNSIRKEERIYKLVVGARRVRAGERIEAVAAELGTTPRTMYRYLEAA